MCQHYGLILRYFSNSGSYLYCYISESIYFRFYFKNKRNDIKIEIKTLYGDIYALRLFILINMKEKAKILHYFQTSEFFLNLFQLEKISLLLFLS